MIVPVLLFLFGSFISLYPTEYITVGDQIAAVSASNSRFIEDEHGNRYFATNIAFDFDKIIGQCCSTGQSGGNSSFIIISNVGQGQFVDCTTNSLYIRNSPLYYSKTMLSRSWK